MTERSDLISGRYQILKSITDGGHTTTFLAWDILSEIEVVLKSVKPRTAALLNHEFRILSQLQHPNIVAVRDIISFEKNNYLVQAFAPGEDFTIWAARDRTPARVCLAAAALLRALQYIHAQGVIHRDIKPEHIRVDTGMIGTLPALRLIDFCLASLSPPNHEVAGTLNYMAPEVLLGEPASPAADLYSWGVLLFEGLFGSLPLIESTPSLNANDLPYSIRGSVLCELLIDMLQPNPERRPTIVTCLEGLEKIVGRSLQLDSQELKGPYLPAPPLVGRAIQIQWLEQAIKRVGQGNVIACQITGCGKSRIALEACSLAKIAGFTVMSVDQPGLLLSSSRKNHDLDPKRFEQKITKSIGSIIQQAKGKPLLLNLDGCSPRDPLARPLLKQLIRLVMHTQERTVPCLILWCNDLPERLPGAWENLNLNCLNDREVGELVQRMLYMVEPPVWLPRLYGITGGDPRLVIDLVHAQIEAGVPDQLTIPLDRINLAEHRIEHLNVAEQKLLAIIAHSPRPIPRPILGAIFSDTMPTLSSLMQKQLVFLHQQGFSPVSIFIRHAAQRHIVGEELQQLHQRFTEVWQSLDQPDNLILGHHLLGGGRVREGVQALLQSAAPPVEDLEQALKVLPPTDPQAIAIQRYLARLAQISGDLRQALAIANVLEKDDPEAGALLKGEILMDAGHPKQALEALIPIKQVSMGRQILMARAYFLEGNYTAVLAEAEIGRKASGFDPLLLIWLDHLTALSLIYSGKVAEGLEVLTQAEQATRAINDEDILARLLNSRGTALQRLGDWQHAKTAYQAAFHLSQMNGDLRMAASCLVNLGTLAHKQLEFIDALSLYRQASVLADRYQIGTTRVTALFNEADILFFFGDVPSAQNKFEEAEKIAREVGAVSQRGHIYLAQVELQLLIGQVGRAEFFLQQARKCFDTTDVEGQNIAKLRSGELALKQRSYTSAREICNDLLERLPWDHPYRWRAHLLAGKVFLDANAPSELDQAIRHFEISLALTAPGQNFGEKAWEAHALLAYANHLKNREPEATYHAERAHDALAELRRKIPISYRSFFDERMDVRAAHIKTSRLWDPESRMNPSVAEFRQLLDINKDLNQGLSVNQLLQHILGRALDFTGAERGLVLLKKEGELQCVASSHPASRSDGAQDWEDNFSSLIAQMVVKENKAIFATDAMEDARFRGSRSVKDLRIRSVLCAPLHILGDTVGALYLDHRLKTHAFQRSQVVLLEAFADQAGIAMENARLLQEAAIRETELASTKSRLEQSNSELTAQIVQQSQELDSILLRLRSQEEELIKRYQQAKIVGRSKVMREIYLKLNKIADSALPVLIFGESGTGKELIARAIHYTGSRSKEPFVSINCAAIPLQLLDSELFGHLKGAFTGAHRDRLGLFEVAGSGTLFLDEIGDMPLEMQSKLLRVLQEGTFRRLGDEVERHSTCRIISASNKRLDELVLQKRFRQDLYYRLNVCQVQIPPLRERREDIPYLVQHILSSLPNSPSISASAMVVLTDYDWPGNVRQLENELQRATILSSGVIEAETLSIAVPSSNKGKKRVARLSETIRDYERQIIEAALDATQDNVSLAATQLGIKRTSLHRKMNQLGITRCKKK